MGCLSTHVLNTGRQNRPVLPGQDSLVTTCVDGHKLRWADLQVLLEGSDLIAAMYCLEFHFGGYFRNAGAAIGNPPFFDIM